MAEAALELTHRAHEEPTNGEHRKLALDLPLEEIEKAARGLRYGTVVITYHQGRAIQIERIERKRLG